MRHIYGLSNSGKLCYSSNNLQSSASWLNLYIKSFQLDVIQCGKNALFNLGKSGDLEEQIKYRHKTSDYFVIRDLVAEKQRLELRMKNVNNKVKEIARNHWFASQSI
jgi:hypothetical protein